MSARLVLLVLLTAPALAAAQTSTDTTQGWLLLTGTGRFATNLRWYGEVQPRYSSRFSSVERVLIRTAVGFQASDKVSVWVGYGWTPLTAPRFADEQRPFLQALVEDSLESVKLMNRFRLEGRFIAGQPSVSLRARHMFRVSKKLVGDFGVAAYDELFVNVNTLPAIPMGLDQNRLFGGVNYAVTTNLTIEAGYIWNHVWRPLGPSNVNNHVALLWLALTI